MTSLDKHCTLLPGGEATWTLTLTTTDQTLVERVEKYTNYLMTQKAWMRNMHVCGNCKYKFRATILPPCNDCTGYSKWEWDEEV